MAAYAYKDTLGIVPEDFQSEWLKNNEIEEDELMVGEVYDWPQWSMLADYIFHLKGKLK